MARLYLIRHGEAAAGFGEDLDPGLSALGQNQSQKAAASLVERRGKAGPCPIISSPLKRCQETATPLCQEWGRHPTINTGVSEIPSPTTDLTQRTKWLQQIMSGTWGEADDAARQWRDFVVKTIKAIDQDTIIFSHFVAINVIAGHAAQDDRVLNFKPDNCSITVIDVEDGEIKLVELGGEAITKVN